MPLLIGGITKSKRTKARSSPCILMLQNTVMDGTASSGLLRPLLASSAFKNTNLGVLTQGSGNRGSGTAVRTIIHVGTDQSKRLSDAINPFSIVSTSLMNWMRLRPSRIVINKYKIWELPFPAILQLQSNHFWLPLQIVHPYPISWSI